MAHPSGRHPVFTRVVAHPCATWAIFPGHGVLGELQGRGFDQRGDLGKGQAVAVFRLLHSSRQPDRSKRCNDRSHAPDAPGGRRPVAMGVERHRDVPRSRAEAGRRRERRPHGGRTVAPSETRPPQETSIRPGNGCASATRVSNAPQPWEEAKKNPARRRGFPWCLQQERC